MTLRTVGAALAVLVPFSLASAHLAPMGADEMVYDSRYIVVATAVDRSVARVGEGRLIVTRYRLAVEDGLRGDPAHDLTVEVVGGTMDGETQETCLTVQLELGARYLLFINDPKNPGFSTFTGAQQGVIRDPGQGKTIAVSAAIAGVTGAAITFPELVDQMRAFIAKTEAVAAPPPRAAVVHDPPLPFKRYEMPGESRADSAPVKPIEAPPTEGPDAPARPNVVSLDASHVTPAKPLPDRGSGWSVDHAATRYIVWNQLPSSYTPWSPHDQNMMARWNLYGDIHRVSANPTNSWGWGNNVFDIPGFVPNPTMFLVFGRFWGAAELAVCFSRWNGAGVRTEADIVVNPAWPWTVDNEIGTRHDAVSAWGFDQTILHEEGHGWGLVHPWEVQNVWWDSVMNYSPKEYRIPNVFADDAMAIRTTYPGSSFKDGLVSFYRTADDADTTNAKYLSADPIGENVQQTGSFSLWNAFKIENVGTVNLVNPQVDIYLAYSRMSWSGYEYLTSLNYTTTIAPNSAGYFNAGTITVPFSFPPGEYYVVLWLRDNADAQWYNNEAWGTWEDGKMNIVSYPWSIYPAASWQYQEVRIGPWGSYTFSFDGIPDTRVDISTCDADGGYANYDTILDLYPPGGFTTSDDACGTQSRLSWLVQSPGNYGVILRGALATFGTSRMMYRMRTWNGPLALTAAKNTGAGAVHLSWSGDAGPYDVQRSTTPSFASPVLIGNGQAGTVLDDPVLASGQAYFYRVR